MCADARARPHACADLYTPQVRVEPSSKQKAQELWRRRQANDRLRCDVRKEASIIDPSGVGFGFGGVVPGWLYAKVCVRDVRGDDPYMCLPLC